MRWARSALAASGLRVRRAGGPRDRAPALAGVDQAALAVLCRDFDGSVLAVHRVQHFHQAAAFVHPGGTRDLLVLLRHTEQHILEALKALHPDWVEADGGSPAVLKFYRAQLGHEPW